MSLKPEMPLEIPELTVRIARAAFPKGNVYMRMRDESGVFYDDQQLAHFKAHQLLKARGKQRTDSTHILASVYSGHAESIGIGRRNFAQCAQRPGRCRPRLVTRANHACMV